LISKNPCETVSKHVLPAVRSLIAKGLIGDYGLKQTEVAKKLGTTQAAISYYLASKRGEKYVNQLQENPQITSVISEITKGMASETLSSHEVSNKLCDLCMLLRKSKALNCEKKSDSVGSIIEYYI